MKKLFLLGLGLILLSGCAYRELNYGGATYKSYSLFLTSEIGKVKMSYDKNSMPTLDLNGFNQDQTEALQTLNLALQAYLQTLSKAP